MPQLDRVSARAAGEEAAVSDAGGLRARRARAALATSVKHVMQAP